MVNQASLLVLFLHQTWFHPTQTNSFFSFLFLQNGVFVYFASHFNKFKYLTTYNGLKTQYQLYLANFGCTTSQKAKRSLFLFWNPKCHCLSLLQKALNCHKCKKLAKTKIRDRKTPISNFTTFIIERKKNETICRGSMQSCKSKFWQPLLVQKSYSAKNVHGLTIVDQFARLYCPSPQKP